MAKYGPLGNMADSEAHKLIGDLQSYLKEKMGSSTDPTLAEQVKNEYLAKRAALDLSNEKLQGAMVQYVLGQLGAGVRVRTGGSPSGMLAIAKGIELMETCDPGTEFVVYMEGASKGAPGPHYVHAHNAGGRVTFVDYQPLARGVNKTPESELADIPSKWASGIRASEKHIPAGHPSSTGTVTPAPFPTEDDGPHYTKMCFIGFEPDAKHVVDFVKANAPA